MNTIIEKKIWLNIKPDEIALTINTYLHNMQRYNCKTVNVTIRKDGKCFNLILISSTMALTKKQVAGAVYDMLTKIHVGEA